MKRKHALSSIAAATLTMAGVFAGTPATAALANANDNTTFSMFIIDDGHGFDPDVLTWEQYQDSIGIFEGLVTPGVKGPQPGIATSWQSSKNGLTWTFHLRSNAKFSNGDPVTAQDFVYSMMRAVDPTTTVRAGAGMANTDMIPIVNEPQIRAGTKLPKALGVKALNDTTLQINLYRKDPTLLRDLTMPQAGWVVPLDQKVVKSMFKNDWTNPQKIVSDGPYMLQSYTHATQAVLVPNPYYYKKVNLKQITFLYSAGSTGLLAYKSGQLDAALLQSTDVSAVNADPSLKSNLHFFSTSVQYSLDLGSSPSTALQNPLVRQALVMAMDRDTISKQVLQGTGTPAYEYFSPTWMDPWIKKAEIKYNPTQAQKLLAKAGYPNGKGFPTLYLTVPQGAGPDIVAQALQQMWSQNLHINVKYNGLAPGQFYGNYNKPLTDGVELRQWSGNMMYPQLSLPQSMDQFLNTEANLIAGYLPPAQFQKFSNIKSDQSLSPVQQQDQVNAIFKKYLPKDILSWINLGVKAYQTNSTKLMQEFYLEDEKNVYVLSVYTPLQAMLIRPGISGYNPQRLLLTVPPLWLNDITRS